MRRRSTYLVGDPAQASLRSSVHVGWVGFKGARGEEAERAAGSRCRGVVLSSQEAVSDCTGPRGLIWMELGACVRTS